ncbi:hypothetical protein [uncultured Cohaesibacter sp.]|uniref:hypothetical protein n=1 Tax=uncultured Cohaesibacter sp. TaxID=1002546 RepID=UPI0029319B2F|nr:hypothetical protein [uncultured Cohaesibacter sp.]
MKRITIIGSSGSGKSTLAFALAEKLGLPTIHIDQEFWQPDWTEPEDKAAFLAHMHAIMDSDEWIIEGNYTTNADLPKRLERSDLLIFMDPPRLLCMWGILTRILKTYGRVRKDMAPGCPERLDWEFIKYVWNFPKTQRPKLKAFYDGHEGHKVRLTGRSSVKSFLISIRNGSQPQGPD